MHDMARASACGSYRACHQRRPHLDVTGGIAHHGGFSGGPARGMHADHLRTRHGKQTERIPIAEILFGRKRKTRQIRQRAHIVRMRAYRIAFRTIGLNVVVRVSKRPLQTGELHALELVAACALDWLDQIHRVSSPRHDDSDVSASRDSHARPDVRPSRRDAPARASQAADIRNTCRRNPRTTCQVPCSSISS